MNLLLHICCAPCSIYPFKELLADGSNKITGFYFNPNIHPAEEYQRRQAAIREYSRENNLEVIYPEYMPDYFFKKIIDREKKPTLSLPTSGERCNICWQMRLQETASFAKQNGFDAFSTTLLISPYQDHLAIKVLGEEVAADYGINFFYQDFRNGFRHSQEEARRHNLYRQKYCGCGYSERENFKGVIAAKAAIH